MQVEHVLLDGEKMLRAFRAHLKREGAADGTVDKYVQHVAHAIKWFGTKDPAEAVRSDLEHYMDHWFVEFEDAYSRAPADDTTRLRISALRSFYDYLDAVGLLRDQDGRELRNPADRLKAPKGRRKPNDWLREDEDVRLLAAPDGPMERVVIGLLRWLGVRPDEAVNLLMSSIDLRTLKAYVGKSKSDAGLREIPIRPELAVILSAWINDVARRGLFNPSGPLLVTRNSTSMKPHQRCLQGLQEACQEARQGGRTLAYVEHFRPSAEPRIEAK